MKLYKPVLNTGSKDNKETSYGMEKENNQKIQDQSSTQENRQNVDQNQHVESNPSQANFQNIQLNLDVGMDRFTGRIIGVTYGKKGREMISNVDILLYFGTHVDSEDYPVHKTKSDDQGNFVIEDLPPGYYTLHAYIDKNKKEIIHNIKVMPGQTCYL